MADLEITIKSLKAQLAQLSEQLESQSFRREKAEIELESLRGRVTQEIKHYRTQLTSNTRKGEERDSGLAEVNKLREKLQAATQERDRLSQVVKETAEQLKGEKKGYQKSEALLQQRVDFQQQEISELRSKNEQLSRSCQKYFQASQVDQSELEAKFYSKLKEADLRHEDQLEKQHHSHEKLQADLRRENDRLVKAVEQLELSLSLERKKAVEAQAAHHQQLKNAQNNYHSLLQRLSNEQSMHSESAEQKDLYYQKRIASLEAELQSVKEQAACELEEVNVKSEQALEELKRYGNQERSQLERRVREEAEKGVKRLREQEEELGRQWEEERENYEARLQQMQERVEQMEEEWKEEVEGLRCDHSIAMQKVSQGSNQEKTQLKKTVALLQQKLEMTTNTLQQQLSTQQNEHSAATEGMRRQMVAEHEQENALNRGTIEEMQRKIEQLSKTHRKAEEINLKLKAEMDNDKIRHKEKEKESKKYIEDIEQKLTGEMRRNSEAEAQLNEEHTLELRRLNEEIERMRNIQMEMEEQRVELETSHSNEKHNLQAKVKHNEDKLKRFKTDYEDLLHKFETTVTKLASQNKGQEIKVQFDENIKRLKQQYTEKMAEKEESINEERRQCQDQIYRLKTDNKQLRDKVILLEARQSTASHKNQQSRYFQPSIRQVESGQKMDYSRPDISPMEGPSAYKDISQMKKTVPLDRSQHSLNVSALTEREDPGPLQERRSTLNTNPRKQTVKVQGGKWGRNNEEGVRPYYPS